MNNIIDTNEALARAYFWDLMTMITRNHGKEKTTQEIPSPRGVADGTFGDNVEKGGKATKVDAGQQRQTIANAIEDCARTFLEEVLRMTITMTEHCRRMDIKKSDVSYALEFFHRPHTTCDYIGEVDTDEVDDDEEDWNMDAEENGAEESEEEDEEVEAEVETDEVDDDEEDWNMDAEENGAEESEEEDEEVEAEADVGYNLTILPFSTTDTKKFKDILLVPMLMDLKSWIPVSNDAVELLRDAMYSFLFNKFSE